MKTERVNACTRFGTVLRTLHSTKGAPHLSAAASALLIDKTDDANRNALRSLAILGQLQERAFREVNLYLRDEIDFYLPEFREISNVLGPSFWTQQWPTFFSALRPDLIKHVFHTGQRLKTLVPEQELEKEDTDRLKAEIDDLSSAILEVVLNETDRERINARFEALKKAVEEYSFWGIDQIQSDFDAAVGSILPLVEKDERQVVKPLWKTVLVKLAALSVVIGNFNSACKNVHDFTKLLESGGQTVVQEAAKVLTASHSHQSPK